MILIAVNSLYLYLVQWRVSSWSVGGGYRLVAGSAVSSMAAHDVDTASHSRTYREPYSLMLREMFTADIGWPCCSLSASPFPSLCLPTLPP